jgi:hypothetical protein
MCKRVSAGSALLHANFTPYRSFLDILDGFSGNRSRIEIVAKEVSIPEADGESSLSQGIMESEIIDWYKRNHLKQWFRLHTRYCGVQLGPISLRNVSGVAHGAELVYRFSQSAPAPIFTGPR